MAGVAPYRNLYPFQQKHQVNTNSTTAVDVWDIPAKTIITMVMLEVDTAAIDAGGGNILVGDDDDDNGFVVAGNICGVAAGTIYGDVASERGVYLNNGDEATNHGFRWKRYASAGKEVKVVCSAAMDTEATVSVYIFGYRYD